MRQTASIEPLNQIMKMVFIWVEWEESILGLTAFHSLYATLLYLCHICPRSVVFGLALQESLPYFRVFDMNKEIIFRDFSFVIWHFLQWSQFSFLNLKQQKKAFICEFLGEIAFRKSEIFHIPIWKRKLEFPDHFISL